MERDVDVVVVGAGLAGLVAARELERRDRTVAVVEARERVGGRLLNADLPGGEAVEVGGQWVGPGQDRAFALLSELGLETHPTWDEGESVLELEGRTRTYSGTIPRLGPLVLADIALARHRLERIARGVDREAPWLSPDADRLEEVTLADWLGRSMWTQPARAMLRLAGRTVWGAEPEEMSLLHAAFYMASAGGLDPLIDVEGGAQELRIVGGSQRVALELAERQRGEVLLGEPVTEIESGAGRGGVVVRTAMRELRAAATVVSVPTPLRSRIRFVPDLPAAHRKVPELARFGRLCKCVAVYPEPFWRGSGLSGESLSDVGPVTLTFDNSPPGGRPGILLGFVGGRDARDFAALTDAERRASVLACFQRLFGPEAATPDLYIERDWGREEWSGGGPTFLMQPGAWSLAGPGLREPVGPVHWAGTETASRWAGFMEGAIRSGERVAEEAAAYIR